MASYSSNLESQIAKAANILNVKRRQSHQQMPGHTVELIDSLLELADLRFKAGDNLRAERLYREAERHGDEAQKTVSPTVRIRTKSKRAFHFEKKKQLDEAISSYQDALEIADQGGAPYAEIRATLHNNLAMLYNRRDECRKAEVHYKTALVLLESVDGAVGNKIGTISNNLGVYYASIGNLNSAFRLFRRGLRMRRQFFQDDNHPAVRQSLKNLGATLKALGRDSEAEECFSKVPEEEVRAFLAHRAVESQAEVLEQIAG